MTTKSKATFSVVLIIALGAAVIFTLARRRQPQTVWRVVFPDQVRIAVDGFPALGPADAPVSLVYYGDYECPHAADMNGVLDSLRDRYGDSLRVVYKLRSLYSDPPRKVRVAAAYAAHRQNRFHQFHHTLTAMPGSRMLSVDTVTSRVIAAAESLGNNAAAFREALHSPRTAAISDSVAREARYYGIRGIPACFVNGTLVEGSASIEALTGIIDRALADTR